MGDSLTINKKNKEDVVRFLQSSHPNIETITISQCKLNYVPDLTRFGCLTSLDLSNNDLEFIPNNLGFSKLISLDISNNKLRGTIDLCSITSLENVTLQCNEIESLKLPPSIKILNISKNKIKTFDFEGNTLQRIDCEDVDNISLSSLQLIALRCTSSQININNDKITNLNISYTTQCELIDFSQFRELKSLSLTSCELKDVPKSIQNLQINSLDVSCNVISSFPTLPSTITYLNISYNQIASIPVNKLEGIKTLNLSGNELEANVINSIPKNIYLPTVDVEDITEIENGIFMGNKSNAINRNTLEKHGIKNVLTIADIRPSYPSYYRYKVIDLPDLITTDLLPKFEQCFEFIESSRENGGVLIHCMAGVSRSGAVLVAYFMKSKQITRNEALAFIKQKRDKIQPNNGFMAQLLEYEKSLNIPQEKPPKAISTEQETSKKEKKKRCVVC